MIKKLFGRNKGDKLCGGCGKPLGTDKFCRYCGTSAKKAKYGQYYAPFNEAAELVYGPPTEEYSYNCERCGCSWSSAIFLGKEKFCPECGSEVTARLEFDPLDFI